MEEIRWCDTHADWAADHLGGVPEDQSRCRWSRFVNSEKACDIHKVFHVREVDRDAAATLLLSFGVGGLDMMDPAEIAYMAVDAAMGKRAAGPDSA